MRRRVFRQSETREEMPLINLTPLIDVVFVILIAFIILAPILNIESVDLASSGPMSETRSATREVLTISIKKDHSVWVDGKKVDLSTLPSLCLAEKKKHPGKMPQVAPDQNAPFGIYQEVKNVLERSGFETMEILLKPD